MEAPAAELETAKRRGRSLRAQSPSIVNRLGGARFNREQPYRTVLRIAATSNATLPPACFFTLAARNLRGDPTERLLILTDGTASWNLARDVVSTLRTIHSEAIKPPISEKWQYPMPYADNLEWWNSSVAAVVSLDESVPEQGQVLSSVLRSASRVVWGDPGARMPSIHPLMPLPRRRPYEIVWTWCAVGGAARRRTSGNEGKYDAGCEPLPANVTDFEVQARVRAGNGGSHHEPNTDRRCARALVVRSTWTMWNGKSWWHDIASILSPRSDQVRHELGMKRGEWMLDDVCVGYSGYRPGGSSDRWNQLAQVQPGSRQILWPMPWQDLYAEYTPGPLRLDSETEDHYLTKRLMINLSTSPLRQCTWHNESTVAFMTELTMDNLYHALIHAVPAREFFERLLATGHLNWNGLHLLPHYIQYWPKDFQKSVGWQILARSFGVSADNFPGVAAQANALTAHEGCHCYRRIFGGHGAFMPPPYMKPGQRVVQFRAALTASIRQPPPERRILFQLRRNGVRQMVNVDEVTTAIRSDPEVGALVRFVVMEELSVIQQYSLISSSRALAGMHGMGLAWSMLLSSEAAVGKSSCLEITGTWAKFNRLDYFSMSKANGVHYMRLSQPNAPECVHCRRCSYRTCGNITANASQIVDKLKLMASWL